jgi:MoaA/NifB/PqqE/SkfB family radical SAM enzyme
MELIRPKQIDIEVTSVCNLKCKLCPSLCNDGKSGHMPLAFFKSIVDRIDWPCTVVAWLNGEPFLNPWYLEMVQYLNEKKQRFYTTTNLTIWREDVLREILQEGSHAYQLIVSMDGLFGSGNIAKARLGTDESVLYANIQRLLALKEELHSSVELAFKICRRGQDWGEIERYIKYWLGNNGVDFVVVGDALSGENDECMRTEKCQYSDNNFMVVRWDGTLVTCAYNDKVVNDHMLSYGRLGMDDNLIETYNNKTITKFRNDQAVGNYPKPCDTCTFAYTGKGFGGPIEFRDEPGNLYWFHRDYYNQFFSKKRNWKPNSYYGGIDKEA